MTSKFEVREHVCEAQHIREYPRATAHSQEEVLHLAIKQYIPRDNPNPQPGDVTIIGAHANGFVKELYEPLWEDLLEESRRHGFRIRSIWIADTAWQGQSGVMNEAKLGNDPSWFDHARDLLHMVNTFSAQMPTPIVGVGHSFGGNVLVNLALMHPRLLTTLVLLDPVLADFAKTAGPKAGREYSTGPMQSSAYRRDLWPSRAAAAEAFARSRFFRQWDPRVLAAWNRHALRDTPTRLYPREAAGGVTLTTTKHQEVFTYCRPRLQGLDAGGGRLMDRAKVPDLGQEDLDEHPSFPFYRPEGPLTTQRLPSLRPPVLWVFAEHSDVCGPAVRAEKMALTGVGVGGSGGAAAGRVAQVVVADRGHLIALEVPADCARHAAAWMGPELQRWRGQQADYERWVAMKSDRDKQTLDDEWMRFIGPPARKAKL